MSLFVKFSRDDLKTFTLGGSYKDTADWGITKIDGIGTLECDISMENPAFGDGADITSERIPNRKIDIVANVKKAKFNKTERSKAISFFNPKHSFVVYITRDDITRWIVAKIERFKCPEVTPLKNIELSIALTCPDPYFYSKDNYGKDIAAVTAGFAFPFASPINVGFRVGTYNFAKQVEVENTGDVDTYATIYIEATGDVTNPKIMQNNAYVLLKDNLVAGDSVEINLVENTIKKNKKNCIAKVDRTSSFTGMVLMPGDNMISFSADDGDANMKVVLYYNLRYLGV